MSKLELKKIKRNARLRHEAGLTYISDPNAPSLEKLRENPKFARISIRTLERWCARDGWVDKRQDFLDRWTEKARERLGSKLVQDRLDELEMLEEIKRIGMEKLRDPLNVPRSWEGTARTIVDLFRYEDELRRMIGTEVIGGAHDTTKGLPVGQSEHTEAELEAAAKEILRLRRGVTVVQSVECLTESAQTSQAAQPQTPELPSSSEAKESDLPYTGILLG